MNVFKNLLITGSLALAVTASAQNAAPAGPASDWSWSLAPYVWLTGIEGDISAGPLTSEFDASFSDLVDHLELAFSMVADGNNGEFGLRSDVFYVELEESSTTAAGKVKGNVEEWIITIAPYARVIDDGDVSVDLGVGGRYVDVDIDIDGPMTSSSKGRSWIDPVLTGRVIVHTAENCFVAVYGDIGGFGVESDLTWQVALTAGYSITESIDLMVGYRHLDIDNEDNDLTYDGANKGFQIGLNFKL